MAMAGLRCNHESECHGACTLDIKQGRALSNFSAYNTRWHMPSDTSAGVLAMWYSFNYGPVHFTSLNSETDFPGAEEHEGDRTISGCPPAILPRTALTSSGLR